LHQPEAYDHVSTCILKLRTLVKNFNVAGIESWYIAKSKHKLSVLCSFPQVQSTLICFAFQLSFEHIMKPHIQVKITYIEKDAQLSASVFGIQ
jgi:hypothetical protein